MRRRGFSLFELLAVLAIITLLMGMILVIPKESDGHRVDTAARELQAVLIQARSLAMRSGATHAVAFHLENAGAGHVLKNFPRPGSGNPNAETGGHWYCIIGPDRSGDTNNAAYIPMLDRDHGDTNRAKKYRCLDDFIGGMRLAQVGEPRYLPRGVRFLALSDLDRGHHMVAEADEGPTYPRPWYGYFDGGRLYAWGGYDPDVDDAVALSDGRPLSGFCYEGEDGEIPYDRSLDTRVNPAEVIGRISDFDQPRRADEVSATLQPDTTLAGTPRSLLSAYWADAMIVFAPDGHAFWVDSYTKRKLFERAWQPRHIQYRGAADIAFVDAVGGYHLTLAPDPDAQGELNPQLDPATGQPAWHRFDSIEDAFDSIHPFARVFVAADTGEVVVKPPSHPDCRIRPEHLTTKDPYPARGGP